MRHGDASNDTAVLLGIVLAVVAASMGLGSLGCGSRVHPSAKRDDLAVLSFDVRDAAGRLIPARLTLIAVGGTPQPKLSEVEVGERSGRLVIVGNKVMSLEGSGEVDVPRGIYDVYVSRGIEWTLATFSRVELGAEGYQLRAHLDHVIDTTGWISGDFHVHAAPSWDSYVPLASRAVEFVVEGVDLIVSTDHNVVADYAPVIDELDADAWLSSMIGDEVTTYGWGHFGVFPVAASFVGQHYGAKWRHEAEGKQIFEGVRRDHPSALIQVNHPRSSAGFGSMGYFSEERFDRGKAVSTHPGFSLDFDAIEVLNGHGVSPMEQVLLDWFALLDHGRVVTAMGNSDTHELRTTLGGYPRNYLRVTDDRPGKASSTEVARAIRQHQAFFTTGPFLELRSGEASIGEVAAAPGGKASVHLEVQAAPWIGVDAVKLYVNGEIVKTWQVPPAQTSGQPPVQLPLRFEMDYDVTVTRDSYVVLRAEGQTPLWPVAGDAEHTQVLPLAITNPLFLDVDGDGKYTR